MATKKNVRVQGSRFWAYEPESQTLIRLYCLTAFDPGSDSAGKIEDTCLDEANLKTYVPGLSDAGEGSLGFNFDLNNTSHAQILAWAESKVPLTIVMGEPKNDVDIPTVDAGALKLPTNRTFWKMDATLTNPVWKFEKDTLVNCTVTMQRKTTVQVVRATT